MNEEVEHIRLRVSRLTDAELVKMVSTERPSYRQVALDLAASELSRRGITPPVFKQTPPAVVTSLPPVHLSEQEKKSERAKKRRLETALGLLHHFGIPAAFALVAGSVIGRLGGYLAAALYWISFILIGFAIKKVLKNRFPHLRDDLPTEEQVIRDAKEAERLRGGVKRAAEQALNKLGLDWLIGDVYLDDAGWHIDFYDRNNLLHHVTFERSLISNEGRYTEEIVCQLRMRLTKPIILVRSR